MTGIAAFETLRPESQLRRLSLHQEVVARIRAKVLSGELEPGQWIPEMKLCEELGISRTPLREALKVLASENLVTLMPNRGAIVTEIVVSEIADLFELMSALEGAVGELVVARASDAEIAEMQARHATLARLHERGEREAYFDANQAIHQRFAELSGNRALAATYAGFAGKIRRARYLANISDVRWAESLHEHEAFTAALADRDAARFSRLLREHSIHTGTVVCAKLLELAPAA